MKKIVRTRTTTTTEVVEEVEVYWEGECARCGSTYRAEHWNVRYCGAECRDEARREQVRERGARYRAANIERERERVAACRARFKEADPEGAVIRTADDNGARRVRACGRDASRIGLEPLRALFDDQGRACWGCRTPLDLLAPRHTPGAAELGHMVPVAQGGSHDLDNVRWTCGPCNRAQGDRHDEDDTREATLAVIANAAGRGQGLAALHAALTRNPNAALAA